MTDAVSPEPATCSARGCRAVARWQLVWNNPRLHTPGRRKVWAACDEHRPTLGRFLAARGFLREVVPWGAAGVEDGEDGDTADPGAGRRH